MNILFWHAHGGWADAFVRGEHRYLLPTTPDHGPFGLGRAGRDWPDTAIEVSPDELADADVDVVVLQRLEELEFAEQWLGRRLGRDVAAVFVEHNTPKGDVPHSVHPLADRSDITIVHVTHFNALMWDTGRAPSLVIEHGVPDPGPLYTGELERFGAVINEPVRRARVSGTDLLPDFARVSPVDVFGMGGDDLTELLPAHADRITWAGDLPTKTLHAELARRRAYLHTTRWTSLGLSLLEAMHLGMPVITLGTTEAFRAVPPEAGAVSADVVELARAARLLVDDPDEARRRGAVARAFALEHYGLPAFLDRWSDVLDDVVGSVRRRSTSPIERTVP
ncbi:Glycosyl transferases group 1 [Paramicrobacterium humi]|uniref:Glycosyl transferases group 1 n=1 Tax=Paramicrobacterium humi TaxID=640635 RepID=A0A1H4INC8_9MICO|nr:glycosyltransferase [Microbacterium humi]SEB35557.1 Glycosyl transferases group 1 [Microbacterium humi]